MPNLQERMDLLPTYRRTRLAPTPSGYLHVGNVASFTLTVGLARRFGARVLLRIDDLDGQRVRPEYVEDIFETLRFLGIPWDEGPVDASDFFRSWSQQGRLGLYREALGRLRVAEAVFACGCSRSDLARVAPDGVYPATCLMRGLSLEGSGLAWRLAGVPAGPVRMLVPGGADVSLPLPGDMQHVVVRRRDGLPSYQLASVVDDLHFGVDLVVRGSDLLGSTLAQLHLSERLSAHGFASTGFVHHPLFSDAAGGKLSKSAGSTSIRQLRLSGLDRAGVFRHIAAWMGREEPASDWGGLFDVLVTAGWAGLSSFH
jgi:glutamyl/glutaminyl-tRNA synthetase